MGDEMQNGIRSAIERETAVICEEMGFHRIDIARAFESFVRSGTAARSGMYHRSWVIGYLCGRRDLDLERQREIERGQK